MKNTQNHQMVCESSVDGRTRLTAGRGFKDIEDGGEEVFVHPETGDAQHTVADHRSHTHTEEVS